MFDKVFGDVEYDYGWCKPETIELFGIPYTITCVASAYKNEMISQQQRAQYTAFKARKAEILTQVEGIIKEYVHKEHDDYSEIIKESMIPKELIFHQNGETGILFECQWDLETGIVAGIFPQLTIIHPDRFL